MCRMTSSRSAWSSPPRTPRESALRIEQRRHIPHAGGRQGRSRTMDQRPAAPPRGVLSGPAPDGHIERRRVLPPVMLSPFVHHFWSVRAGSCARLFRAEALPHPSASPHRPRRGWRVPRGDRGRTHRPPRQAPPGWRAGVRDRVSSRDVPAALARVDVEPHGPRGFPSSKLSVPRFGRGGSRAPRRAGRLDGRIADRQRRRPRALPEALEGRGRGVCATSWSAWPPT